MRIPGAPAPLGADFALGFADPEGDRVGAGGGAGAEIAGEEDAGAVVVFLGSGRAGGDGERGGGTGGALTGAANSRTAAAAGDAASRSTFAAGEGAGTAAAGGGAGGGGATGSGCGTGGAALPLDGAAGRGVDAG